MAPRSGSVLAIRSAVSSVLQNVSPSPVKSLLSEAWRLEPFVPPFTFSAFFSPEDTLLCVCASAAAQSRLRDSELDRGSGHQNSIRIAELTSGSGLVGLHLLTDDPNATLLGVDVDREAAKIAAQNARSFGVDNRARFVVSDLWSPETRELLRVERPQLLICNPPYVPEPPGKEMQLEAGAGPHGTAHLLRALELTRELQPDTLALSWCSLSDPVGIMAAAEAAGYDLIDLFVTAIADGEYSGSVHDYLRDLDDCYINEQPETLAAIASDGAARFAYLLIAGAFVKRDEGRGMREGQPTTSHPSPIPRPPSRLQRLCEDFARDGISALVSEEGGDLPRVHLYILNRWDELQLRVMLHGVPARPAVSAS